MTNVLGLQPLIMERLKTALTGQTPAVHVLSAADLAGVQVEKQVVPALHVVYNGYRVAESRGDGKAARLEQTWLVVVAVRNVRSLKTGDASREQAGLLAGLAASTLMGWTPPGKTSPLKLVNAPAAAYEEGFMYLPLAFVADIFLPST